MDFEEVSKGKTLLTPEEVAGVLRKSERNIRALAEEGKLPARKVGGEWRFPVARLREYLFGDSQPVEMAR